jgi:hypothetical protein
VIDQLTEFLQVAFTGPVWAPSILIVLLIGYSVLVFCGLADSALETPGFGLEDPGIDLTDTFGSFGAVTFHWLNLDRVPIFAWGVVFGLSWWIVSLAMWVGFDSARYEPVLVTSLWLSIRNLVIATGLTKIVTSPMTRWFERGRAYSSDTLLGRECEIQTSQANPELGRARFRTDGAPLLLNVRTRGETLTKGQIAKIVDFDPEKRIYFVESVEATE